VDMWRSGLHKEHQGIKRRQRDLDDRIWSIDDYYIYKHEIHSSKVTLTHTACPQLLSTRQLVKVVRKLVWLWI
jgi:hypothetical protein